MTLLRIKLQPMIVIIAIVVGSFWISSCEKDKTVTGPQDEVPQNRTGAFIINEGNFGQGNSSLDFYDTDSSGFFRNVFASANNNATLGDVANAMTVHDTLGFIMVNNSHKIEVISTNTFQRVRTIQLPPNTSPRNMVISGNGLMFLTALYKNLVYVLDAGYTMIDSVGVGANPEELLISNGKVFVTNSGFGAGKTVSVFAVDQRSAVRSIAVGDGPQYIRADAAGRLHVLCSGAYNDFSDPNDDTPGGVWVIDPVSETVVDSLVLAAGEHPAELAIAPGGRGYFLNNAAIVEYDAASVAIINPNFVSGFFYGLNAHPVSGDLYILDAKDFVSPGELIITDAAGVEKGRFATGVIPGFVAFSTN